MNSYIVPPFFNENKIKNILIKEVFEKEISFVNEALGSFNKQPEVAKSITKEFVDMVNNNEHERDFEIEIDGEKIPVHLVLVITKDLVGKTYASTMPRGNIVGDDIILTDLEFTLYLSQFDRLSFDSKQIFNKIVSIVNHELMHGNIFNKRISNDKNIDIVSWYGGIKTIIENERNELIRNFAYAMYACYYHERQSIVSSTYTQLLELFPESRLEFIKNKIKRFSNEAKYDYLLKLYKESLIKTESYQTFLIINNMCNNLSNKDIDFINKAFVGYGLKVNINKEMIKMKTISNESLKDISRNGSLFFYEFLLNNINNG